MVKANFPLVASSFEYKVWLEESVIYQIKNEFLKMYIETVRIDQFQFVPKKVVINQYNCIDCFHMLIPVNIFLIYAEI